MLINKFIPLWLEDSECGQLSLAQSTLLSQGVLSKNIAFVGGCEVLFSRPLIDVVLVLDVDKASCDLL